MDDSSPKPAVSAKPSYGQWLILSLLLVGILAFALAHAPPGWQRPGPTAFWFAVVAGVCIGGIAVINRVENTWLLWAAGFGIISLAIAGMTAERYRLYVNALKELYLDHGSSQNQAAEALQRPARGQVLEELMEDFHAERRRIYEAKRPFPVFLKFRLQALGISTPPWPTVFWICEMLVGGFIGGFVTLITVRWQSEHHDSDKGPPEPAKSDS